MYFLLKAKKYTLLTKTQHLKIDLRYQETKDLLGYAVYEVSWSELFAL